MVYNALGTESVIILYLYSNVYKIVTVNILLLGLTFKSYVETLV